MNLFAIKELLQHILSFIPINIIIPVALTCKDFYNAITIDYDQESVAKNADMFSLLKIPYCPDIVTNIAAQNNNVVMFEYLVTKHNIHVNNNSRLCRSIGQSGNEYLINKVNKKFFLEEIMVGICDGLHENLFDKYEVYKNYGCRLILYKTNIDKTKLKEYINSKDIDEIYELTYAGIEGVCSRSNTDEIKIYIQNLINTNKMPEFAEYVFRGLIVGGHLELFVWLNKNYKYLHNDQIISTLITKNNFQMFSHILLNNNYDDLCNGKKRYSSIMFYKNSYISFMFWCINYKRIKMVKFLLDHIIFNTHRYNQFVDKAKSFKFNDILNILVSNSHLFEDYNE